VKKLASLFLMTVMLRVWWDGGGNYAGLRYAAGTGIVIGGSVDSSSSFLVVRSDGGAIVGIHAAAVTKMKWVEVKAEREK
jgi:hypothetical protein